MANLRITGKSVNCPVNGTAPVHKCAFSGKRQKQCQFYRGQKSLNDLDGQKYRVVSCAAGGKRTDNQTDAGGRIGEF